MRLRRRHKRKPDPRYPYLYVGPATAWGLMPNTPCRILGRGVGAGGRRIVTPAGRRWTVHIDHLERQQIPAK